MSRFQTKKSLGQHFLNDDAIAEQIVKALSPVATESAVLEIGPGLGVLTKYLLPEYSDRFYIAEIDDRILHIAKTRWNINADRILAGDFLKLDLSLLPELQINVIGNFPYNISSQIIFHILQFKNRVPLAVGMFQREMAKRITAQHGNKDYGVITVLTQAYYATEYLFDVAPEKFDPPPKVHSSVIRIKRIASEKIFDENVLRLVVKTAFNQRRKKLSNALAGLSGAAVILEKNNWHNKRAEELSVDEFIEFAIALRHE